MPNGLLRATHAPGVAVVGVDSLGNDIRRFNDTAIQSQIDAAVARLKPETKGAVIAVGNMERQQLVVVSRPAESVSIVGTLSHDGTKNWKSWRPEIAVRWEW